MKFEGKFLVTAVEDTGVGIPEDSVGKLFKFFGKVEKTNNLNKTGLGFGLTISKMITNQLGGDISVISRH